jgi:hypothetical protein
MTTIQKLAALLAEAAEKRTWGAIEIQLKQGIPILVRTTTQEKLEDYPNDSISTRTRTR